MTMNGYIKCAVCGKVTQVKMEVSYASTRYSFYIPCKNCDTLMIGNYFQDDADVSVQTEFINATKCEYDAVDPPKYLCTITQDFISMKVTDITDPLDTITLPMWMKFQRRLGHENMKNLFQNINNTVQSGDVAIYEWNRVLALWHNGKKDFLKEQLEYFLDANSNQILLENDQQCLSAIRRLTCNLTASLFFEGENAYSDFIQSCQKDLKKVIDSNDVNVKAYIHKLGNLGVYAPIEHVITDRIAQFFQYASELTPIFSLCCISSKERDLLFDDASELGLVTTSFEKIKPLYIDLFESVVQTLVIPVGLNNLMQRGSHNTFTDKNISDIEKFQKLGIAFKKINYLESSNPFALGLKDILNNKLRNSIGHCSYKISNLKQQIYYDHGKRSISLCQIAFDSYQMFLYLLKTFCIVTLLHEAYYKFKDEV